MRRALAYLAALCVGLGLVWFLAPGGPARGQAGAGPHGGYIATDDSCAGCHGAHAAQGDHLTSGPNDNAFCYACHDGTGAPATPIVSTHGNVDFSGAEADFGLVCVACHDPHSSPNLAAIRTFVAVQRSPRIEVGEIIFTARTGTDSFDDGTSDTNNRLCVACHEHPDNSGFPMTNHVGAANHLGGANFEEQDCIGCHPHSADAVRENLDGFMPVGGCSSCHATPQDNGDDIPPGGRRAVIPDFENNSHHVQGTVTDLDCVACHEMTEHQQGQVRLKDADTGAVLALVDRPGDDPVVAEALEPWCLACHDADGAGGAAPFSDGIMPPPVDASVWASASHETSTEVGTCWNCHDNGHGSVKQKLLAPWDATADPDAPDDPLLEEEGFCFQCHDGGIAATDIASPFGSAISWVTAPVGDFSNLNLNDRHDVQASAQATSGAVIECSSCHDPHAANATQKVIPDPDPGDGRVPGSGFLTVTGGDTMTEWCLDCHDGSFSADVTAPTTQLQDIFPTVTGDRPDAMGEGSGNAALKPGFGWTTGGSGNMIVPCLSCHDPHVSSNLFHTVETVLSFDGSTEVPSDGDPHEITDNNIQDVTVNGYNWCNTCHTGSMGSNRDNCFECHYHGTRW